MSNVENRSDKFAAPGAEEGLILECQNCALFQPRKNQDEQWELLNKAELALNSDDPTEKRAGDILMRIGMSNLGDRKCSIGGTAYGVHPCISKSNEFKPQK